VGFEVWDIDAAPSAIKKAKEKAKKRGITVNFLFWDALVRALEKKGLIRHAWDDQAQTWRLYPA
jgi:2-polyprenyl-3-methyl-5-hydroxy-6-metoxy-1,4-benzoquinol methylase